MATNTGSVAVHPTLSTTTADNNIFAFSEIITLSSFSGTHSFTLTGAHVTTKVFTTTVSFVRGTNATAAAIQAALRTMTGDTGLTVGGTTDAGPFTVQYSSASYRRQPVLLVTGDGTTTGSVQAVDPAERKVLNVANHDASAVLYFNVNSVTVPVAAANDLYFVAPGTTKSLELRANIQNVRVVGNGNVYSVELV